VKAGLGVMAVTRRRAERFGLTVWEFTAIRSYRGGATIFSGR
jgi:hypothetical protein